MGDLISRQAAIDLVRDVCDAVMSWCESWYDPETKDEVYKDIREVDAILKCNKEVRIALRNMPSAQPERKTGHWMILRDRSSGQEFSCCNRCDHYYTANTSDWKFCPNCGADMRGEDDETD